MKKEIGTSDDISYDAIAKLIKFKKIIAEDSGINVTEGIIIEDSDAITDGKANSKVSSNVVYFFVLQKILYIK